MKPVDLMNKLADALGLSKDVRTMRIDCDFILETVSISTTQVALAVDADGVADFVESAEHFRLQHAGKTTAPDECPTNNLELPKIG